MSRDHMAKPAKRNKDLPKEPENPNSVLNILKRGFMPTAERIKAQEAADREEAEIKRRKQRGDYADEE